MKQLFVIAIFLSILFQFSESYGKTSSRIDILETLISGENMYIDASIPGDFLEELEQAMDPGTSRNRALMIEERKNDTEENKRSGERDIRMLWETG